MLKNIWLGTVAEITLIVLISAAAGILWNRTLLADAWRGEPTQRIEAAPQAEALPMPIGLAQVKEMHDAGQAVLVDARGLDSFIKEHISGAIPLPVDEARNHPASLLHGMIPVDSIIIAYCNGFSCPDSMNLGKLLIKAGYSSVFTFEGGLPEWRDAGYPVAGNER